MKKSNRMIALILCFAMISALACLSVSAITLFPVGNWMYQKINNNTEFEIYEFTGTNSTVFIPYSHNSLPIASVGANAFTDNTSMQKITISKNVHTVSHHAFLNCTNLATVVFQTNSVTDIQRGAFSGCSSLTDINLEDTMIETIYEETFMNCDSLTEITVPGTVTAIKDNAFAYNDSLSKIVIPKSVTTISSTAFDGSENTVIYCYENSFAHRFAVNNEIPFVLIDESDDPTEPTIPSEPETQPVDPTVPSEPETQPVEPTVPVRTYILGDIDNDNEISVMDATRIQMILVERITEYTDEDVIRGDIDRDGVLSIMDVTSIQRFIADYDDGLDIGVTFEY